MDPLLDVIDAREPAARSSGSALPMYLFQPSKCDVGAALDSTAIGGSTLAIRSRAGALRYEACNNVAAWTCWRTTAGGHKRSFRPPDSLQSS
jgi:hypothetical protein